MHPWCIQFRKDSMSYFVWRVAGYLEPCGCKLSLSLPLFLQSMWPCIHPEFKLETRNYLQSVHFLLFTHLVKSKSWQPSHEYPTFFSILYPLCSYKQIPGPFSLGLLKLPPSSSQIVHFYFSSLHLTEQRTKKHSSKFKLGKAG